VVGEGAPDRAELARLFRGVLALGPHGSVVLGFDGDQCYYKFRWESTERKPRRAVRAKSTL
jgi:hypothetical protein